MRDTKRIKSFLDRLDYIWRHKFPDYRFGQLMINFLSWGMQKHGDPFFWEEDKFIELLEEYVNEGNSPFGKL